MNNHNGQLKLKDDVHITVMDDGVGYLETAQAIHRLEGGHLDEVALTLWPLIDGRNSIGDIAAIVERKIPLTEVENVVA